MWSPMIAAAISFAQPAAEECRADAPSVRHVRDVASGIIAADNQRDLDRVVAYYAADAVLLPPGEPAVVGRAAIRPRYEALFAGFNPQIVTRIDEACASGSLGFVRGHNGGTMASRTGTAARELDDDYLMLLRRDAAGAWRISHLMWHRPAPAAK
jgi:uncharacterized protein (TIGR02246 family)